MEKRPIGYEPGKKYILDCKIPKNPKYSKIQSKLAGKTGITVNDVEVLSSQTVAKRRAELFKRIKASTVEHLLRRQEESESIYQLADTSSRASRDSDAMTSVTYDSRQLGINTDTQFLLLDLQQRQGFAKCHIKEAICCPGPDIKRDKYPQEVMRYKNQEGKLIILYHIDEKAGIEFAKLLFEKGFENCYLISGGLDNFTLFYYDLLEGKELPPRRVPPPEKLKMTKQLNPDLRRQVANQADSRFNDTKSKYTVRSKASSLNRRL